MDAPILPVNEIFETIQGEAYWTGTPAVFVRLQGCDVGCPWCDTKHTWAIDRGDAVDEMTMLAKEADSPTHAFLSARRIAQIARPHKSRLVVITGGEPAALPLQDLCIALQSVGKMVQLETSGTEEIIVPDHVWVTVSPKNHMPGGRVVRTQALHRANEIKLPVGKPDDIERAVEQIEIAQGSGRNPLIWLQPVSQSRKATDLCVASATANGWRVSVQTHKYLAVR